MKHVNVLFQAYSRCAIKMARYGRAEEEMYAYSVTNAVHAHLERKLINQLRGPRRISQLVIREEEKR